MDHQILHPRSWPEKVVIKWAVAQGHTVFVISWANPDAQLADKTFEDYMIERPLSALSLIEQARASAKSMPSDIAWAERCWRRRWPTSRPKRTIG